jgi:2-phosphoglycerate kinase
MGKTLVIYPPEQRLSAPGAKPQSPPQLPFLREILTRSLQEDAGLNFSDAYRLATILHQELQPCAEITSSALQAKVAAHLEREYGKATAQRYQYPSRRQATVKVCDGKGRVSPFSRGRHRHYLQSCGLSLEEASAVTAKLYEQLRRDGTPTVDSNHLARLTHRYLQEDFGDAAARRYGTWIDFLRSDRPLILLIMGTNGSGKSTVATEVAIRLGIVRAQSTDMLREVMRMMLPRRVVPALHTSTFTAWKVLPAYGHRRNATNQAVTDGYLAQADIVSLGCEAVLNRALRERVSFILEGIHIHPSLVEKLPKTSDAIMIPLMLAVLKPAALQERFSVRGEQAPDRRAERYQENFAAIWQLQTFLLAEAERWQVPIISNDAPETAIRQVMTVIIDTLTRAFSSCPGTSFLAVKSD